MSHRIHRLLFGSLLVGVVGVGCIVGARPSAAASPSVQRVTIVSVPTLRMDDVTSETMPALHAFLAQAAIGNCSTKVDQPRTSLADGYATMAAGTRTLGARQNAGLGFAADALVDGTTAGARYTQATGRAADGELVYLGQPDLERANRNALFGTEIGALANVLERAGIDRGVIANADPGDSQYDRTALSGLADGTGRVPTGRVDRQLLIPDPTMAYGVRLDPGAVADAYRRVRSDRSVVLVEASDLWRAERADPHGDGNSAQWRAARRSSDDVFAEILAAQDPNTDAVMVVGPAPGGSIAQLTVAALRGPGIKTGQLSSATTRRAGVVQLVDIAPTVLELLRLERPASMEGRPFQIVSGNATRTDLVRMNDAAVFRDAVIGWVTGLWIAAQAVLCALAIVATSTNRQRWWRVLGPVALGVLSVPLTLWLAQLFPFPEWGTAAFAACVVVGASALAALAYLARRAWCDPVISILGATVALLVVDACTGARLQFNAVFGYSATVAGRFAGLGNLAYATLGASAVLLAGLLSFRLAKHRGTAIAIGLLAVVCIADGLPWFGSDVGGLLSLVPASAYLAWRLLGRRVRVRTVLLGAVVTIMVVVIVGLADMARPASAQTHLGRFFAKIGDQGWDGIATVLARKADANVRVLMNSPWTLMLPVVLILVAVFVIKSPGRVRLLQDHMPQLRPTLGALVILAVLGFALNDSGIAIPGVMFGMANATMVFLVARVPTSDVVGKVGAPTPVLEEQCA